MSVATADINAPEVASRPAKMNELETRFARLVESWKKECPPSSRVEKMVSLPSYQEIIGMGPDIVPLLLRELNRSPDHWFWALQVITGENPVRTANLGNFRAMIVDWNEWAAARDIRWMDR